MPTNRLVEKEKVVTYAAALLDAANQAGGQEGVLEVRDELEQIVRIMRQNIDLTEALSEVTYSPEQRAELVRSVFADCNPVLVDVLAVMAERGDAGLISRISANYGDQITEKLNVTVVDVTTVVELDDHPENIRRARNRRCAPRAHRSVHPWRHPHERERHVHRCQREDAARERARHAQANCRWR